MYRYTAIRNDGGLLGYRVTRLADGRSIGFIARNGHGDTWHAFNGRRMDIASHAGSRGIAARALDDFDREE